jgi:flagellar basal body-associated protein FliL
VKIIPESDSKLLSNIYIVLLSLAGVLILVLLAGTVYAFARPNNSGPLFQLGKAAPAETVAIYTLYDDIRVFSGVGQLRIPLINSSILILSISFPYPHNDMAFTEELAAKIGDFKTIAGDYFSSLPADKLAYLDEEAAKAEILRKYNATLRLGRIEALYFHDLMIIDGNY